MKMNVEGIAPFAKDRVIAIVEGIQTPAFRYLPNEKVNFSTLVFETDSEEAEAAKAAVKKAIKSSELGKLIVFRVVPAGKVI